MRRLRDGGLVYHCSLRFRYSGNSPVDPPTCCRCWFRLSFQLTVQHPSCRGTSETALVLNLLPTTLSFVARLQFAAAASLRIHLWGGVQPPPS